MDSSPQDHAGGMSSPHSPTCSLSLEPTFSPNSLQHLSRPQLEQQHCDLLSRHQEATERFAYTLRMLRQQHRQEIETLEQSLRHTTAELESSRRTQQQLQEQLQQLPLSGNAHIPSAIIAPSDGGNASGAAAVVEQHLLTPQADAEQPDVGCDQLAVPQRGVQPGPQAIALKQAPPASGVQASAPHTASQVPAAAASPTLLTEAMPQHMQAQLAKLLATAQRLCAKASKQVSLAASCGASGGVGHTGPLRGARPLRGPGASPTCDAHPAGASGVSHTPPHPSHATEASAWEQRATSWGSEPAHSGTAADAGSHASHTAGGSRTSPAYSRGHSRPSSPRPAQPVPGLLGHEAQQPVAGLAGLLDASGDGVQLQPSCLLDLSPAASVDPLCAQWVKAELEHREHAQAMQDVLLSHTETLHKCQLQRLAAQLQEQSTLNEELGGQVKWLLQELALSEDMLLAYMGSHTTALDTDMSVMPEMSAVSAAS